MRNIRRRSDHCSRHQSHIARWAYGLVAFLLFAQTALLQHETDLAAHSGGDVCQVCLHGHAFDHAATPTPMVFIASGFDSPLVPSNSLETPTSRYMLPPARGPPPSAAHA